MKHCTNTCSEPPSMRWAADPEFIAADEARNYLLEPMSGAELQAEIEVQMDVPQDVIDRVLPYVVAQ